MQETYARVLRRPRILRGDDVGYLLRVLHNTFVSQHRARVRRPQPADVSPEDLELSDPRTDGRPEEAAGVREVYAAIAALPGEFRDALTAVDVVGLSYAEAAAALRIPEGTLTSRVHRGRAQVARALAA